MSNNKNEVTRLVNDTFATNESEIQCDEAVFQMAKAASLDINQAGMQQQFSSLLLHLQFCSNCEGEFDLLQELAQSTQSDKATPTPSVPNNGRFPILQLAKEALKLQFPGFAPVLGQALTRGEELGFEPTAVSLPNSSITLEFDVGVSEESHEQRDLFITLFHEEVAHQDLGEGSVLWLHQDINGPVIQEQSFDELGDLSFTNLPPGTYFLQLQIQSQHVTISAINLP